MEAAEMPMLHWPRRVLCSCSGREYSLADCPLFHHHVPILHQESSSDLTVAPAPFLSLSNIQQKKRVKIWLYEDTRMSIEGQIIGFDEYMNMTLDDAAEVDTKTGKKVDVGRILLKGDAITLLQEA